MVGTLLIFVVSANTDQKMTSNSKTKVVEGVKDLGTGVPLSVSSPVPPLPPVKWVCHHPLRKIADQMRQCRGSTHPGLARSDRIMSLAVRRTVPPGVLWWF